MSWMAVGEKSVELVASDEVIYKVAFNTNATLPRVLVHHQAILHTLIKGHLGGTYVCVCCVVLGVCVCEMNTTENCHDKVEKWGGGGGGGKSLTSDDMVRGVASGSMGTARVCGFSPEGRRLFRWWVWLWHR